MGSLKNAQDLIVQVREQLHKVVVGGDDVIDQLMVALLSDGHALLESVPGLGKTTLIKALADTCKLSFSRIQNTPDLLPSDIVGTQIINQTSGKTSFNFQKGPIFANIVLADEINRATPKTQAALLEAMQEKQVTVFGETFELDKPFFVLATQNPIDQEGTYPLPEAQTDRFLLKILIDYPNEADENQIINLYASDNSKKKQGVQTVLNKSDLLELQDFAQQVPISKELLEQIVKLIRATRDKNKYISVGASPRASIGLVKAAKAYAFVRGKAHVSKEDVRAMALPILRHRVMLSFEAERENKTADVIIKEIAEKIVK